MSEVAGRHTESQVQMETAPQSQEFYLQDDQDMYMVSEEEWKGRSKIMGIQEKKVELEEYTWQLKAETNDHLNRLRALKKSREELEQGSDQLVNKLTGLKKLQKKKNVNVRILSQKIGSLEDRMHNREEIDQERQQNERLLKQVRSEKAIHKKGYISTDLIRLKRKLDHEIIMDSIRKMKHDKFLQIKEEAEHQKEAIERKKEAIFEENKLKMLEVQSRIKMAKLSVQKHYEQISSNTNQRVKQERWEQARKAQEAQQKFEKLQKVTEIEYEKYMRSKIHEESQRSKYEHMLEKSYEDHKAKIAAMKLKSKANTSQVSQVFSSVIDQSQMTVKEDQSKLSQEETGRDRSKSAQGSDKKSKKSKSKNKGLKNKSRPHSECRRQEWQGWSQQKGQERE